MDYTRVQTNRPIRRRLTMRQTLWITTALVLAMLLPAAGQEKQGVALTVYNGGYGVVREVRSLDIGAGGKVLFKDVATGIDATTVHFKSLTDPAAKLLEQNYQYDLVSADKLLKKFVDRPIEVICENKKYRCTGWSCMLSGRYTVPKILFCRLLGQ